MSYNNFSSIIANNYDILAVQTKCNHPHKRRWSCIVANNICSNGNIKKNFPPHPLDNLQQWSSFLEFGKIAGGGKAAAVLVWRQDEKIDEIFRNVVNVAADNHSAGDGTAHSLVHTISVASNLERLVDRIKNLVEIFYYRK